MPVSALIASAAHRAGESRTCFASSAGSGSLKTSSSMPPTPTPTNAPPMRGRGSGITWKKCISSPGMASQDMSVSAEAVPSSHVRVRDASARSKGRAGHARSCRREAQAAAGIRSSLPCLLGTGFRWPIGMLARMSVAAGETTVGGRDADRTMRDRCQQMPCNALTSVHYRYLPPSHRPQRVWLACWLALLLLHYPRPSPRPRRTFPKATISRVWRAGSAGHCALCSNAVVV